TLMFIWLAHPFEQCFGLFSVYNEAVRRVAMNELKQGLCLQIAKSLVQARAVFVCDLQSGFHLPESHGVNLAQNRLITPHSQLCGDVRSGLCAYPCSRVDINQKLPEGIKESCF